MIRYALKNRERQAAWEKAFPGFGDALQAACDEQFDDKFSYVRVRLICARILYCDGLLDIKKKAIHTKEGYDHNAWNNYPEVTPPEGVWMRVETWSACGAVVRGVFMYVNGAWRRSKYTDPQNEIKAARFRPWDEEEK